ncbi:hypothetical protein [Nocardioides sp. KR10-350]|uniref:hypothetical protein n=1 Tax=Nocardioides cheoyonin TaxID=3156615 RepID=UPI0032B47CC0
MRRQPAKDAARNTVRDTAREATREVTGHPVRETPAEGPPVRRGERIPAVLLWYAVLAAPVAWAVHLLVAWSVSELACLAPSSSGVLLQGGSLAGGARIAVWLGTLVPWLVAVSAVVACVVVTLRRRRLRRRVRRQPGETADAFVDVLAAERVSLLLVVAWFLSVMSVTAITGGGIALAVLEACA